MVRDIGRMRHRPSIGITNRECLSIHDYPYVFAGIIRISITNENRHLVVQIY